MGDVVSAERRLESMTQVWTASGDRRAVFSECYLVMTRRVRERVRNGAFHDGVWVTRLLDRFADYYFDAVEAYGRSGDFTLSTVMTVTTTPDGVEATVTPVPERTCPEIWRGALDACSDPGCHPLQALMLGINAHINHDLAPALVDVLDDWGTLEEEQRRHRHEDHELVNTIIDETTDEVQRDVVAQWSPLAEMLDALMGPLDEWAFGTLAQSWRSQVWLDAMDLVALPPEERPLATQRIGERASGVATVIMLGRRPG
ncbi:MAG TPA: DUF5995 family protein [Ornithinibacter sp.]|nr:DUF5995 family protein [Ornithinibacter sp.]